MWKEITQYKLISKPYYTFKNEALRTLCICTSSSGGDGVCGHTMPVETELAVVGDGGERQPLTWGGESSWT